MYHDDAGHMIGPMPTYGPIEVDPENVQPPFSVRHYRVVRSPLKLDRALHLAHLLAGKCSIAVDGQLYTLTRANEGLTIDSSSSAEITNTDDCILMVYSGRKLTFQVGVSHEGSRTA